MALGHSREQTGLRQKACVGGVADGSAPALFHGDRGFREHLGDDFVGGHFFGFRFVGEAHPVAEYFWSELLHEGRADVVLTAEPGERAAGRKARQRGARRS